MNRPIHVYPFTFKQDHLHRELIENKHFASHLNKSLSIINFNTILFMYITIYKQICT